IGNLPAPAQRLKDRVEGIVCLQLGDRQYKDGWDTSQALALLAGLDLSRCPAATQLVMTALAPALAGNKLASWWSSTGLLDRVHDLHIVASAEQQRTLMESWLRVRGGDDAQTVGLALLTLCPDVDEGTRQTVVNQAIASLKRDYYFSSDADEVES